VPFSAYDARALRLLSSGIADAYPEFQRGCPFPLNGAELADVKQKITLNLIRAYDNGEREPEALKQAALQGLPRYRPPPTQ
jgi:hypothetical protein